MTFWAGVGTKTYRLPDGTVRIVPPNVEYKPEEGEVLVNGVKDITLHFPIDDAIHAEIDLLPDIQRVVYKALPIFRYFIEDKEIEFVRFTDGSIRSFGVDEPITKFKEKFDEMQGHE